MEDLSSIPELCAARAHVVGAFIVWSSWCLPRDRNCLSIVSRWNGLTFSQRSLNNPQQNTLFNVQVVTARHRGLYEQTMFKNGACELWHKYRNSGCTELLFTPFFFYSLNKMMNTFLPTKTFSNDKKNRLTLVWPWPCRAPMPYTRGALIKPQVASPRPSTHNPHHGWPLPHPNSNPP